MASERTLVVGSRRSDLALAQTRLVCDALAAAHADRALHFSVVTMDTTGDKVQDRALQKIGNKNLWTMELDEAVARGEMQFVVHSLKDLPTQLPDGMVVGAITERADARDVVLFHPKYPAGTTTLATLPPGATVGSSSLRRAAQLKHTLPHLQCAVIRGNLNTRVRKLDDAESPFDAIILAAAGIDRLGWAGRVGQYLDPEVYLYAVGQGALGVQCRADDTATLALLRAVHHGPTAYACEAERAFLRRLEGGCSVPAAVRTVYDEAGRTLAFVGAVYSLDGAQCIRHATPPTPCVDEAAARAIGTAAADALLAQGAKAILDDIRGGTAPS